MSIIEFILNQRLILLTVGIAGLILVFALLLVLLSWVRGLIASLKRRKTSDEVDETSDEEALDEADAADEEIAQSAQKTPAIAVQAQSAAQPSAAAKALLSAKPAETTTPTGQPESEKDKAMQDILSSVFSDEESIERYATLLKGVGEVDIDDLQMLAERVASQLHARIGPEGEQ